MSREHERAVKMALDTNEEINKLFARAGNANHPRGKILAAYRLARNALAKQLRDKDSIGAISTMQDLRGLVLDAAGDLIRGAAEVGLDQARRELELYALTVLSDADTQAQLTRAALDSIRLEIDKQEIGLRSAMAQSDFTAAPMLGDGARAGLIAPAPILLSVAYWLGTTALGAYRANTKKSILTANARAGEEIYRRQAVAAIDERTTDCCLRVTGQIVGMEENFHLTGTPRYADFKLNPPFHWYCRTATAIVHIEDMNDSWTKNIRDAARAEIDARAKDGSRKEIHPASATSRR